jgi:hypothetical protein
MPRKYEMKKRVAGRRKKPGKVEKVIKKLCSTPHVWKFVKTDAGVKRTCSVCGFNVTEIGREIINMPLSVIAENKKKEYHPRRRAD